MIFADRAILDEKSDPISHEIPICHDPINHDPIVWQPKESLIPICHDNGKF